MCTFSTIAWEIYCALLFYYAFADACECRLSSEKCAATSVFYADLTIKITGIISFTKKDYISSQKVAASQKRHLASDPTYIIV